MLVAAIADIHGNLPALRAVASELRAIGPDLVVCCGDIASGPLPGETIEALEAIELPLRCIRGNADRGAVEAFDGVAGPETHEDDRWTGAQLSRAHRDLLADLPAALTLALDGLGEVLFCHGSPRRDDEIVLETTPAERVEEMLGGVGAAVVVCGNTHMQFDRRVGDRRLVNVGSVGWPYDEPGACWALLSSEVQFRRTPYDLDAAVAELRARSSWPRLEPFAASLRGPPGRARALAFFERLAR